MLIWRLETESNLKVENWNILVNKSYRSTDLIDKQRDSCADSDRDSLLIVQDSLNAAQALAQLFLTDHSCSIMNSKVLQANMMKQISNFESIHDFSTDLQHESETRSWNDSQNLLNKIKWNHQCWWD